MMTAESPRHTDTLRLLPAEPLDTVRHDVVRQDIAHRWRLENADFVTAHNATIEAEGLPLDAWRTF
jgi:hypothetical protein